MSILQKAAAEDNNKRTKQNIRIYTKKYFRYYFQSKSWTNLVMALIIGCMVAAVTAEDMFYSYSSTRIGLFVLVCAAIWVGIFNSIQTICMERESIRHDHNSLGMPYTVMLFAHMICDFTLCLTECIIILIPTIVRHHSRIIVSGTGRFNIIGIILMFIVLLVSAYCADALGLMVSAFAKTPGQVSTAMPFILIIQFIISGFLFKLKGLFSIISNLTITKWGMQAACIAFDVNTLTTDTEAINNASKQQMEIINRYLEYQKSECILAYDPGNFHFIRSILVLLLFIIAEAVITMFAMKLIDYDKR